MNKQTRKLKFEGDVLLCEDNKMNQELISDRLTKLGLRVSLAEDGEEAVSIVKSRIKENIEPFDLIFMDIHMPVMDGIEASLAICKLGLNKPIIALTANTDPTSTEQYRSAGMNDYIGKPFTRQELLDCIAKYLTPCEQNQNASPILDDDYMKIKYIKSFIRENKFKYSEITKAIDDGDIKLAHRLAHTLKSNAGMIEKPRLQNAAEEVETYLSSGENRLTPAALNILRTELEAALDEFKKYEIEPTASTTPTESMDTARILDLFKTLKDLLDGGSPECLKFVNALRQVPGSETLIQQIEYFEFEMALDTVEELRGRWISANDDE
jgi:CheY-like chemotaxis protein